MLTFDLKSREMEVRSWELGVGEEKSIIDIQSTGLIVTGSSLSPNFHLPTPGFQPARRHGSTVCEQIISDCKIMKMSILIQASNSCHFRGEIL